MRVAALLFASFALATAVCVPTRAQAQAAPDAIDESALRQYLSQQIAGANLGLTRFEVQFGNLDARHTVAPCRRSEPFLASNARLWGRTSVGVRCVDGANWTLMLPVTVRGWGPAVVAAVPLAAGAIPKAQDVQLQDIELTRESPSVLRDVAQLQGLTLNRTLNPGQALRADMFRATLVIQSGDPVRLKVGGTGFAITATGQALGQAAEGQTVRVRTELGKVLTGVAREGRLVEVAL